MARLPVVSGREAVKKFERLGYKIVRQRGSHIRLIHELGRGLLRKLLRDARTTAEEFRKL